MQGYSTLTQKGQVAIPKSIRDRFDLKPFDKLRFDVKDDSIIVYRVPSVGEMRGIASGRIALNKNKHKEIIGDAVIHKFRKKGK